MKEKPKIKVIYKMYWDFPLQIMDYVVGAKTIGKDDSGRNGQVVGTMYIDNAHNREKAILHNEKLKQIETLRYEIVSIRESMEVYVNPVKQ